MLSAEAFTKALLVFWKKKKFQSNHISQVLGLGSWSWVFDRGFQFLLSGSWILGRRSWVLGFDSWFVGFRSQVSDHGSSSENKHPSNCFCSLHNYPMSCFSRLVFTKSTLLSFVLMCLFIDVILFFSSSVNCLISH